MDNVEKNIEGTVLEFKKNVNPKEFDYSFNNDIKGKIAYVADDPSMFRYLANGILKPSVITGYNQKGFTTDNNSIPWKYAYLIGLKAVGD